MSHSARDASLDLAQLRRDKARLEGELAAVQARVGQLTFTVAHDLRAPLRHVGAFAQVIEEDFGPQLPAEALAHVKTIQGAAAEMSRLLDALLDKT